VCPSKSHDRAPEADSNKRSDSESDLPCGGDDVGRYEAACGQDDRVSIGDERRKYEIVVNDEAMTTIATSNGEVGRIRRQQCDDGKFCR